uniref:Uncharacterized protein n=1 Tax=Aedes aegypti TaxID=7159 RepID=A0A0P6IUH3_AEDAE
MPIDHFCMCISCGRYEDTLCPGKSRKFPTRKDPRPVGFEPTTLSLVLLNSCAFTATAIWAPQILEQIKLRIFYIICSVFW